MLEYQPAAHIAFEAGRPAKPVSLLRTAACGYVAPAGSLIRLAFELYASGEYTIGRLRNHLDAYDLRTKSDRRLSVHTLSTILNNPFYMGMIEIRKTGETHREIPLTQRLKALLDKWHPSR